MIRGYINYLLWFYQFFLTNKVACIIILLLVTNILFAIGQTPNYIKNYPPNVYKASPAVYNLTTDDTGILYFGTNKGVVIFDGERWELVTISNFSGVKCLEKSPDGKIYVGANGNFGYLSKDSSLGYTYVSMSDSLPSYATNFNDVWQIVFLNQEIYFQTYSGIFKWSEGKITFDKIVDVYIFKIENQLYGSSYVTGKFGKFIEGTIQPIKEFPDLRGDLVFQIFEYNPNEHLLATSESGLFLFNNRTEEAIKFESEVNVFLEKYDFYDGLKISPNLYGFGSWEGGMVFMDHNGKILNKIDQKTGLYANHIYDMKIGNNNDLWLATSNGISRISLDSLGFEASSNKQIKTSPLLKSINFSLNNESLELFQLDVAKQFVEDKYLIENGILNLYQLPSSLTLYFATPGFAGEETSYSVFLDGYDRKWSDWKSDPMKEYTNLKSGNYTFHVQAKKDQNSELSDVASININIYTPWHQSSWIKFVVALFILGCVYVIIRLMIMRLKTQNIRLEKIVNERTQDLVEQQKKLSELNKSLTLSNKELDSFVYHTSHDLKAPLKSVLGLVDLAKREDIQNKLTQYHDMMESSIHKLEEFISSIIQYSSNSKSDVHIKLIDFDKLIANAISEIQFHDAFEKIEFLKKIESNGSFYSDEKRIQIIINNLISNAIKYYDQNKGNPQISIDIHQVNGATKISIKDNGIGIKTEHQNKVFQMFYRASEKSYGSGLGLYIINETIKKLNGKIELDSKEGEFTLFTIELPNLKETVSV